MGLFVAKPSGARCLLPAGQSTMIQMQLKLTQALYLAALMLVPITAQAEQYQTIGDHKVHYIIVPTLSLKPEIAAKYNITRSRGRAMLNVSVLDPQGVPVPVSIEGTSANLMGQLQTLKFKEVKEGHAIYYLALVRHSDEEMHRLVVNITLPNGRRGTVRWEQKMYEEL